MFKRKKKPSSGKALEGEVMKGGARSVSYGSGHLAPYAPPWAVWLGLPAVSTLTHLFTEASTPAAVAVGGIVAVGGTGLSVFGWHVFAARAHSIRVHATATISAAAAWVMWTTADGLWQSSPWQGWDVVGWMLGYFNGWPWGAWALAGPIACLTWNIRRISRGDGTDKHGGDDFLEKVGIAGRTRKVELEAGGNRVRADVEVQREKHTAADVQRSREQIAALARVSPERVRVIPDPGDFGRASVFITPKDLLSADQIWPGPSAPGESIAEELHSGLYEDGDQALLWLPGDPQRRRNALHLAVSGMTGAGKTESGLCVVTDALTRRDVSFMFSDPVKGIQSVRPIAAGIGLLLTEQKSAVAAFRALPKVIRARTMQLGRYGFKQWTPEAARPVSDGGAGLKYLICWWEEAAALLADSDTFVQVTEQARSAGISLVISQQRLSHDRIATSARSNLGGGWCFGVTGEQEAKFALSDETLDAGAAPWAWKADKPGYSYLEAPGIDRTRWSIPMRGYIAEEDHMTEAVAEYVTDPSLDETTAAAFGKVYADYRTQVAEGAAAWQAGAKSSTTIALAQVRAAQSGPVVRLLNSAADDLDDDLDTDADMDDVDGEPDVDDDPDLIIPDQPEPGFMDAIDVEADIPDSPEDAVLEISLTAGRDQRGLSTADARQALRNLIDQMAEAGYETIEPRQLVDFRANIGRGSSWLTKELRRLVDEGELTIEPEHGVYGIPSRDDGGRVLQLA
ncbi:hypothetical protein [Longispora albida]|uniref:hypothetical protein n=1 Tax=Longispora albida TaxID=203523 RepID=UPI000362AB50|nr:hypothetical protein [Longispora albida]